MFVGVSAEQQQQQQQRCIRSTREWRCEQRARAVCQIEHGARARETRLESSRTSGSHARPVACRETPRGIREAACCILPTEVDRPSLNLSRSMDLSIYLAREGEYENEEAKSPAVGFYLCESESAEFECQRRNTHRSCSRSGTVASFLPRA